MDNSNLPEGTGTISPVQWVAGVRIGRLHDSKSGVKKRLRKERGRGAPSHCSTEGKIWKTVPCSKALILGHQRGRISPVKLAKSGVQSIASPGLVSGGRKGY